MNGVNRVIVVGRLGRDFDLYELRSGMPLARGSIAINEGEAVVFVDLEVPGPDAKQVVIHTGRGDSLYVEGYLRNNRWTDRDGVKHDRLSLVAQSIVSLGRQRERKHEPSQPEADTGLFG